MRCASCGVENAAGRAYCGRCARPLGALCAACQFLNGPGERYCGGCARDLRPAAAPAAGPGRAPGAVAVAGAFADLSDLIPAQASSTAGGDPGRAAVEATQDAVDGFFQRLVREGVAKVRLPEAGGGPPGPPRRPAP